MNRRHFIAAASTAAGAHAMPAIAQESAAKSLLEHFAATLSTPGQTRLHRHSRRRRSELRRIPEFLVAHA
jgi:hypothetical protein